MVFPLPVFFLQKCLISQAELGYTRQYPVLLGAGLSVIFLRLTRPNAAAASRK